MIPIVSLSNLVNTIVTMAIVLQLVARSNRLQQDGLRYLTWFFIFLAGFWAFRAMPGLIVITPTTVMLTNLVSYVFLFSATTSLLQVPFIFLGRGEWGAILGIFNIVAGIVFILGRLFNPVPHPALIVPPYIFWQESYSLWLRVISGLSAFMATTLFMAIFFYLGYKDRGNAVVYRRSMHLALGMAFIVVAAAAFFLLSQGGFLVSVLASASCIVGLLLMLRGISFETSRPAGIVPT